MKSKKGIIYNDKLSHKILEIAGRSDHASGSVALGKFHLQEADDGSLVAVVTFD